MVSAGVTPIVLLGDRRRDLSKPVALTEEQLSAARTFHGCREAGNRNSDLPQMCQLRHGVSGVGRNPDPFPGSLSW